MQPHQKFRSSVRSIAYEWASERKETKGALGRILRAECALLKILKLVDGESIRQLNLCTRTLGALLRAGYKTIEDLAEATPKELKAIRLIGPSSLVEIAAALDEFDRGGTELNCIAVRTDLLEGDD